MGYEVAQEWHPWKYANETQVGGYATRYATKYNFTFITVRGGAHAVFETAPARAFEMFNRLLKNGLF